MLKLILILLIGLPNLAETTQCVAQYGQCGGTDYTGSTQCCASSTCVYINLWYSQCIPSSASSTTSCSAVYGQCGGVNWSGPTCCDASTCTYSNAYYSQCLPAPSSSSSSSSSSSTSSSSTSTTTTTTTTTTPPSSTSQSGGGSGCNSVYSQCGGQNWPGSTCCVNSICIYSNPYYSQCLPTSSPSSSSSSTDSTTTQSSSTTSSTSSTTPSTSSTTSSTSSTTPSTSSTTTANQGCSAVWEQCGGIGWNGPTTCCSGSTCTFANSYYSQCIPSSESSTSPSSSTSSISSTTIPSGDGNRQPGVTTRYWDCCKASCGWPGKASVSNPVQTCAQDGIAPVSANNQSVCTGGTGYMCINQQPWNVSSTLSYGYAAAHISGQGESDWCCACYSLIFTSGPVIGKELIVQITNTGGDLGNNHFDLQMPGGGVGLFDGCSRQFPGPYSWGQTYGGVSERSNCSKLPVPIQTGCYWRFDWFMNADNPTVDFKQVACPSVLTDKTQCIRR